MLFDLRVVLAACLATFIFVAVGIGLMSGSHSSFKAAADGPRFAGPGLPQSMPLPLPDPARGEDVTGTIADQAVAPAPVALKPQDAAQDRAREDRIQERPAQEKAQEKAQERVQERIQEKVQEKAHEKTRETRAAPARGKRQTITSLIEEDAAAHPKPAAKPKPKRRRHPKQAKQPPPSTNPFAAFMNNNNPNRQPQTTVR